MRNHSLKSKSKAVAKAKADQSSITVVVQPDSASAEALLVEAKKEPKRKLLMDYSRVISTLRLEKRFTFRAIAEWFAKRGIETDHSAVYRTYLASIPEQERSPYENWEHVDEPGYGDESVEVKKP